MWFHQRKEQWDGDPLAYYADLCLYQSAHREYNTLDEEYSNDFVNRFYRETMEVNYRYTERDYNLTVGIKAEPSQTYSYTTYGDGQVRNVENEVFNFSPTARFRYNFGRRKFIRIDYRLEWEADLLDYLKALDAKKPVILCGDLNVAHQEIDIKNPDSNRRSAGFTDEERGKMTALLEAGFADSFRLLHPDEVKYSWWSYRFRARARNAGWRIDYFLVSKRIADRVRAAEIHNEVMGSDHCPVELDIDLDG